MTKNAFKKTRIIGQESYINSNTGELVTMDVIETDEKDVDTNFYKLFMKDFLNAIDIISNQKMKVAFWIVDNLNKDNQLLYSYRQIAEMTGIGYQTVATTVKALKDADFLRESGKFLIINPDIVFKGTAARRANVLHRYKEASRGDIVADKRIRIANMEQTIASLQRQIAKLSVECDDTNNVIDINDEKKGA